MTTAAADGRNPEWTPMLKRILLLLTIVATGGGIICSVFYGIWTTASYLSNIDHSIQELTKSGESRDQKVLAVKNALEDPNSPVNKTLAEHGKGINDLRSDIGDIKDQLTGFEIKSTGSAPASRGHDARH
jgi:hypothetical protein